MKIAIIGASGKEGRLLTEEAVSRGHEVTGFVRRNEAQVAHGAKKIVKDAMSLTGKDLSAYDAVIDAIGLWTKETLPLHTTVSQHLCDCLAHTGVRLLVVGGAGSLYVDKAHTVRLVDSTDFPPQYKPTALAQADELDALRGRDDVKWTFLSPAAEFIPDGSRTGRYRVGGEEMMTDSEGKSKISYADYAAAMIDEIEKGTYVGKRFSVIGI